MEFFLTERKDVPDPRASNSRHDLCELLVVAFVAVLCGRRGAPRWPPSAAQKSMFSGTS